MKLTEEHLAPYLPYSLKVRDRYDDEAPIAEMIQLHGINIEYGGITVSDINGIHHVEGSVILPILRPLSDLTREIEEINKERFVPKTYLEHKTNHIIEISQGAINGSVVYINTRDWEQWQDIYWIYQKLFEWHFDVFWLIENDLAIDKNKIKIL